MSPLGVLSPLSCSSPSDGVSAPYEYICYQAGTVNKACLSVGVHVSVTFPPRGKTPANFSRETTVINQDQGQESTPLVVQFSGEEHSQPCFLAV